MALFVYLQGLFKFFSINFVYRYLFYGYHQFSDIKPQKKMQIHEITDPQADLTSLIQLYIEVFGEGEEPQYIDANASKQYFKSGLVAGGKLKVISINKKPIAFLFFLPANIISHDFPLEVKSRIDKNSIYIAELAVDKQYRSQGLGKQLLSETLIENRHNILFIRVRTGNTPAMTLYEKLGFIKVAACLQTRLKPDGVTSFEMQKTYLYKPVL